MPQGFQQLGTLTVLCKGPSALPLRSGFQWDSSGQRFTPNAFYRHVEPLVAKLLELEKLQAFTQPVEGEYY